MTELYPNGDEVQTVEPWTPPAAFDGLDTATCNRILDAIVVNEPLFAFLCLFLRLTGLGTLVTGPGKSRGMFVHYLVPLMGLLGLKGAPASSKT